MGSPKMDIVWIRGEGTIDFRRPNVFFSLGARGGGKSSFLEVCAAKYLENGGKVIDLFGARDGEGLAWLRSPYAREKKVVLLRGDLVEVNSGHESIPASKFRITDLDRGDIFISSSPLYSDMDEEFDAVNRIINVLWRRHYWTVPIFAVMREAANLIYSRVKVRHNQNIAKAEVLYMMRESRHVGVALGLDSIKHSSIDVDIRTLTDYLIIKNTGMHGLPQDLWWVYKIFDPGALRKLDPGEFIIVDRHGHLGLGTFEFPSWHKKEEENILRASGLEIRYLQPAKEGDRLGEVLKEALESLPPEPTMDEVVAWLNENKNLGTNPHQVGIRLRDIGYYTQRVFREGKLKSIIKKAPVER